MREDGSGKKWIVTVTNKTVSERVFIHATWKGGVGIVPSWGGGIYPSVVGSPSCGGWDPPRGGAAVAAKPSALWL
jgi:hypothetical protein